MQTQQRRNQESRIWYLAYGSNMSTKKFSGSRGITPQAAVRVRAPNWTLAFNVPGLPYSEPSFTSIVRREIKCDKGVPDVHGVAYLITREQYIRVLASEGGGIMYADVELHAVPVTVKDAELTGPNLKVHTLLVVSVMERNPWPLPSKRYMEIVLSGSQEFQMPYFYRQYLSSIPVYLPPTNKRRKIGAAIFLSIWGPVMGLMEKLTHNTMSEDGCAPFLVIWLVRFSMLMIWWTHDFVFAPVYRRGDGCDREAWTESKERELIFSNNR